MNTQQMMPMMREMHQRHAAMADAWAATADGVYVVRSGQLLKYDEDLKLVKTVDLPEAETEQAVAEGQQAWHRRANRPCASRCSRGWHGCTAG